MDPKHFVSGSDPPAQGNIAEIAECPEEAENTGNANQHLRALRDLRDSWNRGTRTGDASDTQHQNRPVP
jgi:hypothetical protein